MPSSIAPLFVILAGLCFAGGASAQAPVMNSPYPSVAPLKPILLQHGQLPPGVAARPVGVPRVSAVPRNSHANASGALLPTWTASFNYGGTTYPYTIVGRVPQLGGTTRIDSVILPVFIFLGYLDNGQPVYFDGGARLGALLASPLFQNADYATGTTQFQDAVQRASFGRVAKPSWHTLFSTPRVLTPLALYIPPQFFTLYQFIDTGTLLLQVDEQYWEGLIDTLAKTVNVGANELLIVATDNVFGSTGYLGFHGLGYKLLPDTSGYVPQTFAWASWLSPEFESLSDAATFSHEFGEWMNDPYISNVVPAWAFGSPAIGCLDLLETADPLVNESDVAWLVSTGGATYHMVNQVTLAWFSRQALGDSPSLAYSFPDTTLAAGPSTPCPF